LFKALAAEHLPDDI